MEGKAIGMVNRKTTKGRARAGGRAGVRAWRSRGWFSSPPRIGWKRHAGKGERKKLAAKRLTPSLPPRWLVRWRPQLAQLGKKLLGSVLKELD
ncbi:hypothetical protein NL676_032449 [Syzygium grande]|nr:hypothetical protein NL676_032449 [Syzygium grande]